MSSKGTPGSPAGDRVARATALIRALAGVVDATVEADGSGIRTIAVVADPALSAWEITRNVQSALLASLGLAIDMAVVEVTRPSGAVGPVPSAEPGEAQPAPFPSRAPRKNGNGANLHGNAARQNGNGAGHNGNLASKNGNGVPPARNGRTNGNGKAGSPGNGWPATNGHGRAAGPARTGRSNGHVRDADPTPFLVLEPPAGEAGTPAARSRPAASIARLELEARAGGRVACRVVVSTSDRIAAGEADAVDTPHGRLDASARAVVAASPVAGIDLDAVRLLDLAGRKYVIAAVRCWNGSEMICRVEVVPVQASPEAAAAQATLSAILK